MGLYCRDILDVHSSLNLSVDDDVWRTLSFLRVGFGARHAVPPSGILVALPSLTQNFRPSLQLSLDDIKGFFCLP